VSYIEYLLFLIMVNFLRVLPCRFVLFFLKCLFYIFGYICGVRKKVVIAQLRLCYPEKTFSEIKQLTKRIYKELAITCAEVFIFDDKYFEGKIELIGMDVVNDAHEQGRGVIVVSAHFSNWELGAKILAKEYNKVYGIIKAMKNRYFNEYINKSRNKAGIETINMKSALKHIVAAIKNNQIVAVLTDQYASKQGVKMDFLGFETKVYTSVAQLALKYKVPVIVAFDVRDDLGYHKIYFHNPSIDYDLEVNEENILLITQKINEHIEDYINNYPHLWFWVHRKFRNYLKNRG